MKLQIEFFKASEKLPEQSGRYLTVTNSASWTNLSYSAKHKLFNVYDCDYNLYTRIDVEYWAEISDLKKSVPDRDENELQKLRDSIIVTDDRNDFEPGDL